MICIKDKTESYMINGYNMYRRADGVWELWVTRANNKNWCLLASTSQELVEELKSALDFAVKRGERVFEVAV